MGVHKLPEEKAAAFKSQHNMYKKRILLPPEKRLTKPRTYQKFLCPISGCHKVWLSFILFVYIMTLKCINRTEYTEVIEESKTRNM